MAGTKANRRATKTDTLIRIADQSRQARGLDRHRIIPRVTQLPSGGGNNPAGGGHVGTSGSFLDPIGDTMIGAIAFQPKVATIDKTNPDLPSIDIDNEGEDYSTYVLAGTSSPDKIGTILNVTFSGQLLYLQSTSPTSLELINGDAINLGNILTGTGASIFLDFGDVATLIFDSTAGTGGAGVVGAWRVVSGGQGEQGSLALLQLDSDQFSAGVIQFDLNSFFGDTSKIEETATLGVFKISGGIFGMEAFFGMEATGGGAGTEMSAEWEQSTTETGTFVSFPDADTTVATYSTGRVDFTTQPRCASEVDARTTDIFVRCFLTVVSGSLTRIIALVSGGNIQTAFANVGGTGGGAGATQLNDLTDVTLSAPLVDQVLTFDGAVWINKSPTGGGLNTDLSNLAFPTNLAVDFDFNLQDLVDVKNIIMNDSSSTISGIRVVSFFQLNNSISDTSAQGLLYQVDNLQKHSFFVGGQEVARFDEPQAGVFELNMNRKRINNADSLTFDPNGQEEQFIDSFSLGGDQFGGGRINWKQDANLIFTEQGTTRVSFTKLLGIGYIIDSLIGLGMEDAQTDPVFAGQLFRNGNDVKVFSGGQIRNFSDIEVGGGGNEISQGNTSITILDSGTGSIAEIVDGNVVSIKDASNFAISQNTSFGANELTGLGTTTPASVSFTLGDATRPWGNVFAEKITFDEVDTFGNFIENDSPFGINYSVSNNNNHDFLVANFVKLRIERFQATIFVPLDFNTNSITRLGNLTMESSASDIEMAQGKINNLNDLSMRLDGQGAIFMNGGDIATGGGDITSVGDITFAGIGSTLNLNNGQILNVDSLSMRTNVGVLFMNAGEIAMGGGDITSVDDITFVGSGSFINMNGGDIFNIDDLQISGDLNHDGSTIGFFGQQNTIRRVVRNPLSTGNNDLFIAINDLINALGTLNGFGLGLVDTQN